MCVRVCERERERKRKRKRLSSLIYSYTLFPVLVRMEPSNTVAFLNISRYGSIVIKLIRLFYMELDSKHC